MPPTGCGVIRAGRCEGHRQFVGQRLQPRCSALSGRRRNPLIRDPGLAAPAPMWRAAHSVATIPSLNAPGWLGSAEPSHFLLHKQGHDRKVLLRLFLPQLFWPSSCNFLFLISVSPWRNGVWVSRTSLFFFVTSYVKLNKGLVVMINVREMRKTPEDLKLQNHFQCFVMSQREAMLLPSWCNKPDSCWLCPLRMRPLLPPPTLLAEDCKQGAKCAVFWRYWKVKHQGRSSWLTKD